jgi:hypothetical protein
MFGFFSIADCLRFLQSFCCGYLNKCATDYQLVTCCEEIASFASKEHAVVNALLIPGEEVNLNSNWSVTYCWMEPLVR